MCTINKKLNDEHSAQHTNECAPSFVSEYQNIFSIVSIVCTIEKQPVDPL